MFARHGRELIGCRCSLTRSSVCLESSPVRCRYVLVAVHPPLICVTLDQFVPHTSIVLNQLPFVKSSIMLVKRNQWFTSGNYEIHSSCKVNCLVVELFGERCGLSQVFFSPFFLPKKLTAWQCSVLSDKKDPGADLEFGQEGDLLEGPDSCLETNQRIKFRCHNLRLCQIEREMQFSLGSQKGTENNCAFGAGSQNYPNKLCPQLQKAGFAYQICILKLGRFCR